MNSFLVVRPHETYVACHQCTASCACCMTYAPRYEDQLVYDLRREKMAYVEDAKPRNRAERRRYAKTGSR